MSLINDTSSEDLGHSHLFYTGKFCFQIISDYLFVAHSVIKKSNLKNKINIAMTEVASNNLTVDMLTSDSNEKVNRFISSERAFTLMNGLKETPTYWKRLAMVKQLGVPTCFTTLASAEMRWNELIFIISKLNKQDFSDEGIQKLSNNNRCMLMNSISVLVARHFHYHVDVFNKEIIVNDPLLKVICHAIWVYVLSCYYFLGILNAPTLTAGSKEEYITFVDKIVSAYLPEKHKHSYKNREHQVI